MLAINDRKDDFNFTHTTFSIYNCHSIILRFQIFNQFSSIQFRNDPEYDCTQGKFFFNHHAYIVAGCESCSIGYYVNEIIHMFHYLADHNDPDNDLKESKNGGIEFITFGNKYQ